MKISPKLKAFVINLEKDKNRMQFMHDQLSSMGLKYERFSAIDGRKHDFGAEYIESEALKKNGHILTPGELGCAVSHKRIYQQARKEGLDYILVLEDDVLLPKNFKNIVRREIEKNEKKKNWEYLSFDYVQPGLFLLKHWLDSLFLNYNIKFKDRKIADGNFDNQKQFLKETNDLPNKIKYILYSVTKIIYIAPLITFEYFRNLYYKYFRKTGDPVAFYRPLYLAGSYLLSKSGVEKVLRLTDPVTYPADRVPNEAKKQLGLKFRAYAPLVVSQQREKFGSSILNIKNFRPS